MPSFRVANDVLSYPVQMSLVSRVQHPYVVEYKESWVEKVRSLLKEVIYTPCLILSSMKLRTKAEV